MLRHIFLHMHAFINIIDSDHGQVHFIECLVQSSLFEAIGTCITKLSEVNDKKQLTDD